MGAVETADRARSVPARSFLRLPRLRLMKRRQAPGTWRLTGEDEARILEPHRLTVRAWTAGG